MVSDTRKLNLISEVLKINNEGTFKTLEIFLKKLVESNKAVDTYTSADRFAEFSGIWAKEEAEEFERIIADTCENINPDDWK